MNISLCITNYNRTELLYESFKKVIGDDRISEIVIVDDCSHIENYNAVKKYFDDLNLSKIKLYRNEKNLDCYLNKREAISKSSNEWVIIFDSDNIIDKTYIDRIESLFVSGLNNRIAYAPDFAKPHFNFTHLSGTVIGKENIAGLISIKNTATMLNAMNYFVNRDQYLRVFDSSVNPVTSDSIYQNYNWLKAGHQIYVVPDLQYEHRVHGGSHYQNNVSRTPRGFHDSIIQKLKELK